MKLTIMQRKEWAAVYPPVTPLTVPQQCEGFVSQSRGKKPCKKPGYWKFRFDKRNPDYWHNEGTMIFCWNHLSSRGIQGDMFESDKFQKWCDKNNYPERLLEESK